MAVDLPAPFGPRKPVTRPGAAATERSSIASVSPYRFAQPCAWITAAIPLPACASRQPACALPHARFAVDRFHGPCSAFRQDDFPPC
jgi:hypothetical protein